MFAEHFVHSKNQKKALRLKKKLEQQSHSEDKTQNASIKKI